MATFTNQATLSYNNTVTNSNIVTGEITEVLSATKTATSETYGIGDNVTYVVSIVNTGNIPYTGVTVNDDLGAYTFGTETLTPLTYVGGSLLYYTNGVLQPNPEVSSQSPLQISGITVPAGGNATIIYDTVVNEYASGAQGASITNNVNIGATGLTVPLTATETVTADTSPNLTITKSLSPETVVENGQLTYTFVIQNSGSDEATATDNVSITDSFNPILSGISVTYNGTAWSEPTNYTYDETTGIFTTLPGQITVPGATYSQSETGVWTLTPGTAIVKVTGTV